MTPKQYYVNEINRYISTHLQKRIPKEWKVMACVKTYSWGEFIGIEYDNSLIDNRIYNILDLCLPIELAAKIT